MPAWAPRVACGRGDPQVQGEGGGWWLGSAGWPLTGASMELDMWVQVGACMKETTGRPTAASMARRRPGAQVATARLPMRTPLTPSPKAAAWQAWRG